MTHKTCVDCDRTLLVSEFWKRSVSPDGLNKRCKQCAASKIATWRRDNPDKVRKYNETGNRKYDSEKARQYRIAYRTPEWRERTNASARQRRRDDPEYRDRKNLRDRLRTYNLKPQDYWSMLAAQDNKCAACGVALDTPHIDHDHTCCPGRESCGNCVRGLLCLSCNFALGFTQDNPETLKSLIDYLKKWNAA